jgi:hypothetical protein
MKIKLSGNRDNLSCDQDSFTEYKSKLQDIGMNHVDYLKLSITIIIICVFP